MLKLTVIFAHQLVQQMINLFIVGFAPDTDECALEQLFVPFGQVVQSRVMRDPASGQAKGYGFVKMALEADGLRAIHSLNGTMNGERRLSVRLARGEHGTVSPEAVTPPAGTIRAKRPRIVRGN